MPFEKQIFVYSCCVFFGLAILSILGLYLDKIDNRISGYMMPSTFPAIVCLMTGIKSFSKNVKNPISFYGATTIFVSLILFSFPYFVNDQHSIKLSNFVNNAQIHQRHENFQNLVQFLKDLQKPKKILLPKVSDQNIDTDILQVESFTPVEVSRSNRPHLIYMTNSTLQFASDIRKLNNAYFELIDSSNWKPLINLALNKNCSHILINDQEVINEIFNSIPSKLKTVFKNQHWLVLQINS